MNQYKVIGVMSGTSLDGIDIIYASFSFKGSWRFEIHSSETIPYTEEWRSVLKGLVNLSQGELDDVDKKYTHLLCRTINDFINKCRIDDVDAVCSHGHTALHQPEKGLTLQIGNLPIMAKCLQQTVVCDFRVQDVQLGGQGAPLVPIGDKLLFGDYEYCLNLGGFANLSTHEKSGRVAYDICPVNIVLNNYMTQFGLDYDHEGQMASTGKLNEPLLHELNSLTYYSQPYPKSLGYEWVKNTVIPLIDTFKLEGADVLRTFVEHIAVQISIVLDTHPGTRILITGGGVYNLFLMKRIRDNIKGEIVIPSEDIIEYKEALIFGLLGVLKLRNEVNCLQSVTGASKDHSSGAIYNP